MALLFMDSFEHTTIAEKWSTVRGTAGGALSLPSGRFGLGWDMNQRYLTKALGAAYTTLIHGFALKPVSNNGNTAIASFLYDASTRVACQVTLAYNHGTSQFNVYRGQLGATLLGSAFVPTIPTGSFTHIEWKVTFNASTGSVVVRLNGQVIINLTNQNTAQSGTTANGLLQGCQDDGSWSSTIVDDVYLLDNTDSGVSGAPNNDFWGDTRIECLYPDNNGNSSQLVGSDGNSTNNYLLVDEATPNTDTDYVESSTPGDKDTYSYGNLVSTAGSVYGVGVYPWAKKTDAGTRSIKSIARLSATEVDGPEKFLGSGYGYMYDYREAKPGGGQWTISDVNSAEYGVKVFA